jgi:hypothetical protein
MGTRSVISFITGDIVLLSIYRQMDGYLTGRGKELAEFMRDIKVVNGIGSGSKGGTHANGEGCLAAQWLAAEKNNFYADAHDYSGVVPKVGEPIPTKPWKPEDNIGSIYVQKPEMWPDPEDVFIEWFYQVEVKADTDQIIISVCNIKKPGKYLFQGSPERMLKYIENYETEDGEINLANPYAGVEGETKKKKKKPDVDDDMKELAGELFA